MNEAYNCDCLDYMKTLPDNAFDLAVVDPPYGDGLHAEDGGGKGWFAKYNQAAPESEYNKACSQSVQVERERERARAVQPLREPRKPVRAVQARHGQGANVRQPDGSWGYAKWRTEAGGGA